MMNDNATDAGAASELSDAEVSGAASQTEDMHQCDLALDDINRRAAMQTAYVAFNEEINQSSAESLLKLISIEMANGTAHIYLGISSLGGDTHQAMFLRNALRGLPVSITTHNLGTVASAAMTVFMAGTVRLAVPDAKFLMHNARCGGESSVKLDQFELRRKLSAVATTDRDSIRVIAESIGRPVEDVEQWFAGETYQGTDFAILNGLIDFVCPFAVPHGARFIMTLANC